MKLCPDFVHQQPIWPWIPGPRDKVFILDILFCSPSHRSDFVATMAPCFSCVLQSKEKQKQQSDWISCPSWHFFKCGAFRFIDTRRPHLLLAVQEWHSLPPILLLLCQGGQPADEAGRIDESKDNNRNESFPTVLNFKHEMKCDECRGWRTTTTSTWTEMRLCCPWFRLLWRRLRGVCICNLTALMTDGVINYMASRQGFYW